MLDSPNPLCEYIWIHKLHFPEMSLNSPPFIFFLHVKKVLMTLKLKKVPLSPSENKFGEFGSPYFSRGACVNTGVVFWQFRREPFAVAPGGALHASEVMNYSGNMEQKSALSLCSSSSTVCGGTARFGSTENSPDPPQVRSVGSLSVDLVCSGISKTNRLFQPLRGGRFRKMLIKPSYCYSINEQIYQHIMACLWRANSRWSHWCHLL